MRIVMIVVCRCMSIVFLVMLARRCTASGAEEGEVCSARHVGSSHECANKADDHERVVTVVAYVVDDLIFGEEAGEREHPSQCERGNDPGGKRDRHYFAQAAHVLFHVERMMRCAVTNRAGAKEQTRFEKCVRKDVEDGWQPCASAKAKHHVAQLTDG